MQSNQMLLPQLVKQHATSNGTRCYLKEVAGASQTYRQTYDASLRWTAALHHLGVGAEGRVITFMPARMETVNIWLGLSWLSAINVPINTEYRGDMLSYVIGNAKAEIMICAEAYLPHVLSLKDTAGLPLRTIIVHKTSGQPLPADDRFQIIDWNDLFARSSKLPDAALEGPKPWEIAMVMYTSGTSGASKGAMLTWANFANGGYRMKPDLLTADDVMYSYLPMYHVGGTFWLNSLAQIGASMVIREKFSLPEFWSDIREHGCTVTFLLGAAANFILKQDPSPEDSKNPLRYAQVQPLPEDVDGFERRFGMQVYTVYGSTEMGVAARTDFVRANTKTCGRIFPELEVRLVDENDYEVPDGEVGELVVRSKQPWIISAGYFEMPQATATAWRNLWFHSGDALRRDSDGNYYFVDRVNDAIRRRGENISSLEVETYISRFEGVLECAAVGVPSELGEADVMICVVPKPDHLIDPTALINFLESEQMPRFMVPRYVKIMSDLPKTVTGKVQKRKLKVGEGDGVVWDREASARRAGGARG